MISKEIPNEILIPEIAKLVASGHSVTMNVKGFSMRPFIEASKNTVIIEPWKNYRPGDVVLARVEEGNRFVLHRIIDIQNSGSIILQGDGNIQGTETCKEETIVGRCKAIVSKKTGRQRLCDGCLWNAEFRLWFLLRPARRYLLALYRLARFGHIHNSKIKI